MTRIPRLARRLLVENVAQDLVEYALLAALIGIAGAAAAPTLEAAMSAAYISWNQGNVNLWATPEPQ